MAIAMPPISEYAVIEGAEFQYCRWWAEIHHMPCVSRRAISSTAYHQVSLHVLRSLRVARVIRRHWTSMVFSRGQFRSKASRAWFRRFSAHALASPALRRLLPRQAILCRGIKLFIWAKALLQSVGRCHVPGRAWKFPWQGPHRREDRSIISSYGFT